MMIIYLSLFICLFGAFAFNVWKGSHNQALFRDMFWVGLVVFLLQLSPQTIGLLR